MCLGLAAAVAHAPPAAAQSITGASYAEPTTRYAHGILGDAVEWGALRLTMGGGARGVLIRLPQSRVFEDLAPRLADLDGDGGAEVIVVETDLSLGARLAIYDETGVVAATPFIGRPNRWLAPVGAADLDGDGRVEIAYVDRPHLAKVLRVWRFADGALREVASTPGLSNHRIGEDFISGGIRDCGGGPEMILATGDWREVVAARFDGQRIAVRGLAPLRGPASLDAALDCRF